MANSTVHELYLKKKKSKGQDLLNNVMIYPSNKRVSIQLLRDFGFKTTQPE